MSQYLSEADLVAEFQAFQRHPNPNNALYLEPKKARELINECQANDLCVIGFEGFELRDGLVQPQLDLIADYSSSTDQTAIDETWKTYQTRCNRNAVKLIETVLERVELVIELNIVTRDELRRLHLHQT